MPLTTLPPLMVRYAFRVGKSGRDLSHAEKISSMAIADREACEPFLPPYANRAHADGNSIITDLLTNDFIRWEDICPPGSVNLRGTMFR